MKTLTLMHGVPGSGKSYLAKQKKAVICSADHFFEQDGEYKFDAKKLGQAHQACKDKALEAIRNNENIVIDNTNLTYKECKPYIDMAHKHGYTCVIEEPNTTWKNNAEECFKRNTHNVPLEKIQQMINKKESVSSIWTQAHKDFV